jgi:hypothetical protein
VNREGEDGEHGQCFFIYLNENRTMKPVEIILKRGEGRENDGRENPTKAHCKRIWKITMKSPCMTNTG